ncbi:MAG: hypothetical protein AAF557_18965 [Pseudomonadota bacterium]
MQSAKLRGHDFQLTVEQVACSHADFFADVGKTDRLGVIAPNRVDGIGATTLIMSYVTAFYDAYRTEGNEFFAYPAFFSFQPVAPAAYYSMLDIWPLHKNVVTGQEPVNILNAINDRGINILILPDREPSSHPMRTAPFRTTCPSGWMSTLASPSATIARKTSGMTNQRLLATTAPSVSERMTRNLSDPIAACLWGLMRPFRSDPIRLRQLDRRILKQLERRKR